MVKILNISIFHEKAIEKKKEKSSLETFWSLLQQIKELLSLQLRSILFIFSLKCNSSPGSVQLVELFKEWELLCIQSGLVSSVFHGHSITSTI